MLLAAHPQDKPTRIGVKLAGLADGVLRHLMGAWVARIHVVRRVRQETRARGAVRIAVSCQMFQRSTGRFARSVADFDGTLFPVKAGLPYRLLPSTVAVDESQIFRRGTQQSGNLYGVRRLSLFWPGV